MFIPRGNLNAEVSTSDWKHGRSKVYFNVRKEDYHKLIENFREEFNLIEWEKGLFGFKHQFSVKGELLTNPENLTFLDIKFN